MAGIPRYTQKIFGLNAGSNQMAKYGSFLSTPELYSGATINPDIIQALSNFEGGLYDGVGGAYSPTIQDFNSILRLYSEQLSYLLSRGIPEWDPGTTYNLNDFCKVGKNIYYSLIDNNINNAPLFLSSSEWKLDNIRIRPFTESFSVTGPGSFSMPEDVLYATIFLIGGGGGGAGSFDQSSSSSGGDGQDTIFYVGSDEIIARKGLGGVNFSGGAGGDYDFNSNTYMGYGSYGGKGNNGLYVGYGPGLSGSLNYITQNLLGGNGGGSFLGDGGNGTSGIGDASINFGGGGGGGGLLIDTQAGPQPVLYSGGGGGAGGHVFARISNPTPGIYNFSVGAGGLGGSPGIGGQFGGRGQDGIVIVTLYFS